MRPGLIRPVRALLKSPSAAGDRDLYTMTFCSRTRAGVVTSGTAS